MNEITYNYCKECSELYMDIKMVPFYKADDGYRYASYILETDTKNTQLEKLLNSGEQPFDEILDIYGTPEAVEAIKAVCRQGIEKLEEIIISDDDITAWTTFHKEQGGVAEYHRAMEWLEEQIAFKLFAHNVIGGTDAGKVVGPEEFQGDASEFICRQYKQVPVDFEEIKASEEQKVSDVMVLNHRNPFADISINEQDFLYGSVLGQFETLSLSTNFTMTKAVKDTERSYLVMQPGFKIKKEHMKRISQDIIFDDTLSTKVVKNDDNIYIYIE